MLLRAVQGVQVVHFLLSVKMSNKTAQKFSDELPEVMDSTYLEKYLAQKQKEANLSENDIEKILQSYGYK